MATALQQNSCGSKPTIEIIKDELSLGRGLPNLPS